jgi:hypothetical protein
MAQFTKNQIDTKITTDLADNNTKAISAQDVRDIVKDYITASTYAPVMIYSGILKHDEGSGSADRSIKELYYNPDFFAKQLANDPTNAYNIYKLSTIVVAANDNTYLAAPNGGDGEDLRLSIVVSSNQVTSMTVIEPGFGYKVGDVLTFSVGATNLTVTYQGAVRAGVANQLFALTINTDNTYSNHTINNTVVAGTPLGYSQGSSEGLSRDARLTTNNILASRVDLGDEYSENLQHIQLYRVAENS